jgi:hypothetical protein
MGYDPASIRHSYRVTFRDGKVVTVVANNPADAKREAVRRRYNPGTLPDQLEKQRNVSDVTQK